MENVVVSIITPCYNAGKYISQTIESVLSQTYTNWEMLIIDDCSTDNSADIIQRYAQQDHRIKYLKTKKASGSPSIPRNLALDNAKGDVITFLDSDDCWLPEKLEKQITFLKRTKHQFIYSNYEKMDSEGNRSNRYVKMLKKSTFWDVLESCWIPCLTVMLSRDIIGETRFKQIPKEDFEFWLNILKKGIDAYNQGEVLALYREQQESRSSNKLDMIRSQWYILRRIEGIKRPIAIYLMIHYLFHGFLKYLK